MPPVTSGGGQHRTLGRRNNLDAIRLALAVLVIGSHAYMLTYDRHPADPLATLTGDRHDVGGLAVNAFLSISGYLIAMSYVRSRSGAEYLRKRLARILPGYVAAYLISVLVVTPLASRPMAAAFAPRELARAVFYGVTFNNWEGVAAFPDNPTTKAVNGSRWTIHYEVGAYLLVLLVGAAGLLRGWRTAVAGWLVVTAVSATLIAFHLLPYGAMPKWFAMAVGQPWAWARLLSYFAAGTALYLLGDRVPRSKVAAGIGAATFGAALFAPPAVGAVLMPPTLTYLLFWLAGLSTPRLHDFAERVGGDYSYGTYLYGFPAQQLAMWGIVAAGLPRWLLLQAAIALPLALLAGALSWHLVESRFLPQRATAHRDIAPPPQAASA